MKIAFLLHDAYGIGGTVSATLNLAGALAKRHEVEIVSVFRTRDTPQGNLESGVRLTPLLDIRANSADKDHQLSRQPSVVSPRSPSFSPLYNALTDQRIGQYLDQTLADVVIATRPVLLMYLAHFGERAYLRIGQEHLTHDSQIPEQRERQNQIIPDMDAFVTVSHADAEIYQRVLPHAASRILSIPNPVTPPSSMPAQSGQRIVVAAGRLVKVKRYDVLVRAFEQVVRVRPDWCLRIYGSGKEEQALRELVMERGLYNHVRLMGAHAPMETEWAKGDIAAVTSDNESFGMTIVEAMQAGLPVVSTDCPLGPREIIQHGVDGFLALPGDPDSVAQALLAVMNDDQLRHRMSEAARQNSYRFAPEVIAQRYEELFARLGNGRVHREVVPASRILAQGRLMAEPGGMFRLRLKVIGEATAGYEVAVKLRDSPEVRTVPVIPGGLTKDARDQLWTDVVIDPRLLRPHEGTWDFRLRTPEGLDERIVAEGVETQHLSGQSPWLDGQGVSSAIPYRTMDDFIAIRTWYRAAHAEIGQVVVDQGGTGFHVGLLLPQPAPAGTALQAVLRHRSDRSVEFAVPVQPTGGAGVAFTVPHREFLLRRIAATDIWDLWLRVGAGGPEARAGRIGGDIIRRKHTDRFPSSLDQSDQGVAHRTVAYVTDDNDLSFSVKHA
ncbi:glycosyltransferase family 4 protein [Streptomyces poriferorum]|uniref:glycosyltransferase family 4 protein n=1 Tax=Streptomyces TaxID=1883 RepID=UPI00273E639B|nr:MULTISPECIES: glycosyltransferase family 4 protein [unclassified Streptomyces]WLQ51693.1 glycosyltransferase family 4 protein [Streptomyces sp. Alt1]WSI66564.1 glycosyltransferase family 4 protein [Streptomyces sp. NBC_01336]